MKLIFSFFMMLLAIQAPMLAKSSSESSAHCKKDSLCPKRVKLPRVNISNTEVQPKGSLVFNCTDKKVYFSDGTNWIALEDEQPAEKLLVVDQSICYPDGVTTFNTIQSAIDSLGDQNIVDTTIMVAKGVYSENVVLQSLLCSDPTNLKIVGDTNPLVGVGINHGSAWNFDPAATLPVGGGVNSIASLSASGNTLTVSAGAGIDPDFSSLNGGGYKVIIRDSLGSFAEYSIVSATGNTITMSAAIIGTINAPGAAMVVAPNVEIAPPTGTPLVSSVPSSLTGFFMRAPAGQPSIALETGSFLVPTNNLCYGGRRAVQVINPAEPSVRFYIYAILREPTNTAFGNTYFTSTTSPSAAISNNGSTLGFANSLIASAGNGGTYALSQGANALSSASGTRFIGQIGNGSRSHFALTDSGVGAANEIIVYSGDAALFNNEGSTVEQFSNVNIKIVGPSTGNFTVGIWNLSGTYYGEDAPVSISSTETNFVGVITSSADPQLGVPDSFENGITNTTILFGDITLPASPDAYVAKIDGGAVLKINDVSGTVSLGAGANGFQASNGSSIYWYAGSFNGSNSGILFDIRGNSMLILPSRGSYRTFANFQQIFNFDDNSTGNLNSVTCTTNPGGTNLSVSNMSRVEIGNVTFNLSGANIGINSAPNGNVEKKAGATFTNNAQAPISASSCSQTFSQAIGNYTCTKNTGLIVVSP